MSSIASSLRARTTTAASESAAAGRIAKDFEQLLSDIASASSEELLALRERIADGTTVMSDRAAALAQVTTEFARAKVESARALAEQGAQNTREIVRDKPLQSVAVAAGAGFALGVLFALLRGRD
ncbi:glycine zipper domain-containing protein [Derxia gummosa]|uniref:Glycine zipper domain-containing protein n=1 Tax=Derxia gummosa DSM 723 TaxID=1121388 RepID=A0A8B6X5A3_9BURK|nr:DUF883 family protein [Derxia gummosa]